MAPSREVRARQRRGDCGPGSGSGRPLFHISPVSPLRITRREFHHRKAIAVNITRRQYFQFGEKEFYRFGIYSLIS
jgi:hypothetical protein